MLTVATVYNRLERTGVGRGACYDVADSGCHPHINFSSVIEF